MKKFVFDRASGKPLMSIELFLKYMLKYKILSPDEALTAERTGLLPSDIMERILKTIDETRKN